MDTQKLWCIYNSTRSKHLCNACKNKINKKTQQDTPLKWPLNFSFFFFYLIGKFLHHSCVDTSWTRFTDPTWPLINSLVQFWVSIILCTCTVSYMPLTFVGTSEIYWNTVACAINIPLSFRQRPSCCSCHSAESK